MINPHSSRVPNIDVRFRLLGKTDPNILDNDICLAVDLEICNRDVCALLRANDGCVRADGDASFVRCEVAFYVDDLGFVALSLLDVRTE